MYVCMCMHTMVHVERSKGNFERKTGEKPSSFLFPSCGLWESRHSLSPLPRPHIPWWAVYHPGISSCLCTSFRVRISRQQGAPDIPSTFISDEQLSSSSVSFPTSPAFLSQNPLGDLLHGEIETNVQWQTEVPVYQSSPWGITEFMRLPNSSWVTSHSSDSHTEVSACMDDGFLTAISMEPSPPANPSPSLCEMSPESIWLYK